MSSDPTNQKGRDTWSGRFDFVVTCLGYAVGLANIWRFPYLCFQNGGGAFMVPYLILLMLGAVPLVVLEFAVGQYSTSNMMNIWNALPIMRGLSYGQFFAMVVVRCYYCVIITYSVYFCFASFTSNLPWVGCHHPWNTPYCSELLGACLEDGGIIITNGSCANLTTLSEEELGEYNVTVYNESYVDLSQYTDPLHGQRKLPSEEYWRNELLQESSGIEETGGVVWQIALCNLFVWIVIFFIVARGIKISGKVAYFTALFPYIMLTALLIRALTLDGSGDGVRFFVNPRWQEILKPKPWKDAALQVFFSSGAGMGSMTTLGSFNTFHNNFINDALLVVLGNSLTSMYCGLTVFSILGFLAKQTGVPVNEVVKAGFGLVFIVCPAALAKFPAAPVWSVMFFFMLFLVALDSQFVGTEVLITVILDAVPGLRKWRVAVVAMFCSFAYMASFAYMTNAGSYWMSLVDSYAVGWASIICGFVLPLSFGWVYGFDRLKNDIRSMIGNKIVDHWAFNFWKGTWLVVTPMILTVILLYNMTNWKSPEYNGPFPVWCHVIGWLFIASTTICIPGVWIYDLVRFEGSLAEVLALSRY
ncbi:sodium- and chloride-dependent neutral and basic amino acid transporter B(0+)-like [Diadema setosum]|uniref:sodium- and chloride-dependent neutral and basic amino acid transporter B(0+)-like n=1 Tax=Diadema setosum TaxID=31175 RepID=UPI003B3B8001